MSTPLASAGSMALSLRTEPLVTLLTRHVNGLWRLVAARPSRTDASAVSAVAEAAEVRAMAWRLRGSQPGFASDLLAAADRHERRFGVDA